MGNFKEDLAAGNTVEDRFCVEYLHIEPQPHHSNAGYDIIDPNTGLSWEVKFDILSKKYGNFYIELNRGESRKNERSGLASTTSDRWCIFDGTIFHTFVTEHLKAVIKEMYKNKETRRILTGGNGNSGGLVINCELLLQRYKEYTEKL